MSNYDSKIDNKHLVFSIGKAKDNPNHSIGFYCFSLGDTNFVSSRISEKNDWLLMKRLMLAAVTEVKKDFNENIERLSTDCWNKFFDSKQGKFDFLLE